MMPMYTGEDGAATCARAAAAAAVFDSVVVLAVVVATFLRTLDLGTSFLHADNPPRGGAGGSMPPVQTGPATIPDHQDRTSGLLAYGVSDKLRVRDSSAVDADGVRGDGGRSGRGGCGARMAPAERRALADRRPCGVPDRRTPARYGPVVFQGRGHQQPFGGPVRRRPGRPAAGAHRGRAGSA